MENIPRSPADIDDIYKAVLDCAQKDKFDYIIQHDVLSETVKTYIVRQDITWALNLL